MRGIRPEYMLGILAIWLACRVVRPPRLRQLVLALGGLAFLLWLMPQPTTWLAMVGFLAAGFAAGWILRRHPSRALLAICLAALTAGFVLLNHYTITPWLLGPWASHTLQIVGLSYMFFRTVRFVVYCAQGQMPHLDAWSYWNWQTHPFALLAGPIITYEPFRAFWQAPAPLGPLDQQAWLAWLRILVGFAKAGVLAPLSWWTHEHAYDVLAAATTAGATPALSATLGWFAVVLYTSALFIYLNFSGYCDIGIAGARLVGLRLPENFNWPVFARSMLDFWERWHRTLGLWVRDLLFLPMYRAAIRRTRHRGNLLGLPLYFLSFFLIGIWHGTTSNFVVFAVLQGLGVSLARLWRTILERRGPEFVDRYMASMRIRIVAVLATLHYACLTALFFYRPLGECLVPIRALGLAVKGALQ